MLENWTNGRLRATRHRVIQRLNRQRFSIVFFAQPDKNVVIKPIQQLVDEAEKEEENETNDGGGHSSDKAAAVRKEAANAYQQKTTFQACTSYEFIQLMMNRHQS